MIFAFRFLPIKYRLLERQSTLRGLKTFRRGLIATSRDPKLTPGCSKMTPRWPKLIHRSKRLPLRTRNRFLDSKNSLSPDQSRLIGAQNWFPKQIAWTQNLLQGHKVDSQRPIIYSLAEHRLRFKIRLPAYCAENSIPEPYIDLIAKINLHRPEIDPYRPKSTRRPKIRFQGPEIYHIDQRFYQKGKE